MPPEVHDTDGLLTIAKPLFDPSYEYVDASRLRLRHFDLPQEYEIEFRKTMTTMQWSLAANSARVYLGALRNYWSFCARNNLERLANTSVAHYLITIGFPRIEYLIAVQAGNKKEKRGHQPGVGRNSIATYLAAIEKSFRTKNIPPPSESPIFREWLSGFYRRLSQPKDRKDGILREDLRRAVDLARREENPLVAARDAALLLLGFSCALRRSELAAVGIDDIRRGTAGWNLWIQRSKTDQSGNGVEVPIYPAHDSELDVIAAIDAWRSVAGIMSGPLFRRIRNASVGTDALSPEAVSLILKKYGGPLNISGHSLRVGFMTQGGMDGKEVSALKIVSRHKSTDMAEAYIRSVHIWKQGPGTLL